MTDEGVVHQPEPDSQRFRIARAALETGKIAALNEGVEEETEIIVIVQVNDEEGASLSQLSPEKHLQVMARALQDFADKTNQPIQVMFLGERGGAG